MNGISKIAAMICLLLLLVLIGESRAAIVAEGGDPIGSDFTIVGVVAAPESLVSAIADRDWFEDDGSVVLLDNGLIVVSAGGDVVSDDAGNLWYRDEESVVFQLDAGDAFASLVTSDDSTWIGGNSVASWTGVVSLQFADSGRVSIVVTLADGTAVTLGGEEPIDVTNDDGPSSCSAGPCTSDPDSTCNIWCPRGWACLAYCDGAVPVCRCIPKSRVRNLDDPTDWAGTDPGDAGTSPGSGGHPGPDG